MSDFSGISPAFFKDSQSNSFDFILGIRLEISLEICPAYPLPIIKTIPFINLKQTFTEIPSRENLQEFL